MIYQIGLLLIQFCLFWRYFEKGRWSGLIIWTVFLFSAFIYFYGLFIDTLYLADRLWFLSRDFLVIGGSAILFFISLKWGRLLIPAIIFLSLSTLFLHTIFQEDSPFNPFNSMKKQKFCCLLILNLLNLN